ncbi:MAG: gliding motility-associated C-terminal domain-containing protein [Lewinellaceae bacterium]|nr:gliding motility-associated C-terminal domain-containing protein [Lewinellaceae bacterium]
MRFPLLATLAFIVFPFFLYAQNEDCITAEVICSDGPVVFNPSGSGIDDFADPDNDNDCLLSFENQSGWYYFEFRADMPPNSQIEFTVNPDGGFGEDYDFAIFGPDVNCGNLGSPIRCSYAASNCAFCPQTGLGNGATDLSESAFGDGFVAPLIVQPGQGFYLLLDNWLGSSTGFSMTWGGSAAPFLNCNVDPTCDLELTPGAPVALCGGDPAFSMPVSVSDNMGGEVYSWTATGAGLSYLSATNVLNPTVTIPQNFSGTLTYTLTATEGNCEAMADVVINVSPLPTVSVTGPASACGDATVTLSATPGLTSYVWSNGGNTPDISVTQSGTYSVTATDSNGCQNEDSFTVEILPGPELTSDGPVALCGGDPPFSMPVSVTGVMGAETYSWTGTALALSYLSATNILNPTVTIPQNFSGSLTYSLTVTEGDCDDMIDITIMISPLPDVFISGPEGVCEGSSANLSATPGYPGYQWSNGGNSANINVTEAGTYTVTVTDSNGCQNETSFDLAVYPLPAPQISGNAFVCLGHPTVLTVTPGFETYLWSNGATSQTATYSEPGIAMLLVTDANGCEGYAEFDITDVNIPPPVIIGDPVFCPGETSTLYTEDLYAGYFWSNGSTDAQIVVSEGDNYFVTVTDANGCEAVSAFVVLEAPELFPQILGVPGVCEGEVATLVVQGNYPVYDWSTGATNQSVIVNPGTYSVTITDNYNCSFSTDFTLTENPLPDPEITGLPSFCLDASTTLSVSQNFDQYYWSNGATTQSVEINEEGNHSVTVVDINGCIGETSIMVSELEMLEPGISGTPEFCTGSSTILTGESGYVSYLWSNGEETQSVTIDSAGVISLYVTDNNGCSGSTTITTLENPLPEPQINTAGYFCEGDSVLLEVNTIYPQYSWSNAATTSQIFASQAGNYFVNVTDANGCEATAMTTIESITLPVPGIEGSLQFCPGTTTSLLGEEGFVTYQWSGGQNSQDISITLPGDYSLTVTDSLGCPGTNTVSVSEFIISAPLITGPLQFCPGTETTLAGEDGFISYTWSNGISGQTALFDETGGASLTVTDPNGCITSSTVNLSEFEVVPPQILGEITFCSGQTTLLTGEDGYVSYEWSDGSIEQSLSLSTGGSYQLTALDTNSCYSNTTVEVIENALPEPQIVGPLTFCIGNYTVISADQDYQTYSWSTGSGLSSIQVNAEGIYSLAVSNEFGCMDSTSVFINQETELEPVINGPLQYCENENTLLDAGPGYAAYLWSNGQNAQTITVTEPGTYSLTVTDAGGCSGDGEVVVQENPLPAPQIQGVLQFCQNESTELDAGTGYDIYAWTGGGASQTLSVINPGDYAVTVTDSNGCSNTDMVSVIELPLPDIEISGQFYFCEDGSTSIDVSPGYALYSWSNGSNGTMLNVNVEGTYTVTVTDQNGCQSETGEFVAEIPTPVANAGGEQFLDCDTPSAVLQAGASSQGPGMVYSWTGPGINVSNEMLLMPEVSLPGAYQLMVTDETYGCFSAPSSVLVTDLSYEPMVQLEEPDVLDCITETVMIDGSNSQSGSHITYQWFDGQNNPIPGASGNSLLVNSAQTYTLLVMDTLTACSATAAVPVDENYDYPVAEAGPNQHLDCIVQAVVLDGGNSQQGATITYQWESIQGHILSGENGLLANVDEPGYYFLTVLNTENGCSIADSVLVTQDITPPIANAGMDMQIDCHTASVQLNGSASSNGGQYALTWTQGNNPMVIGTTPLITVENPGIFHLQVTNLTNGCTSEDQTTVLQGPIAPTGLTYEGDPPTCSGDSDGALIIQEVLGGTGPYSYSLNGGDFQQNSIFNNLTAGLYEVLVQDVNDCEFYIELELEDGNDLVLDLGDDQIIELGEEADLYALFNIPEDEIMQFAWNPDQHIICNDCFEQHLSPLATTTYRATLTDINGCSTSDLVTVYVQKNRNIFIPNVFSPNHDGNNDVFMIFSGKDVVGIRSFQIYNRWGENVFEVYDFLPNNPAYGWDGRFRGIPCNSAVFVWYAEVEFVDGEIILFKGDVTLVP